MQKVQPIDGAGTQTGDAKLMGGLEQPAPGRAVEAGAITNLIAGEPDRFERIVFLLPAALDVPLADHRDFDRTAERLETLSKEEAVEAILTSPDRVELYERAPWLREFDALLWQDMNPQGVARAIREVVRDVAVEDRELLRRFPDAHLSSRSIRGSAARFHRRQMHSALTRPRMMQATIPPKA